MRSICSPEEDLYSLGTGNAKLATRAKAREKQRHWDAALSKHKLSMKQGLSRGGGNALLYMLPVTNYLTLTATVALSYFHLYLETTISALQDDFLQRQDCFH